jgi:hypothetical protein
MRTFGSIIIGVLTGITIPIYNGKIFSVKNIIILICLLSLWFIIYSLLEKKNIVK